MINKNFYRKTNDKKILHKVGKQWKVISVALLMAVAGGAVAATHANANADDVAGDTPQVANDPEFAPAKSAAPSAKSSVASAVHYYPGHNGSAASYFDKASSEEGVANKNYSTVNAYVQSLNSEYNPQMGSLAANYNSANDATHRDSKLAKSYRANIDTAASKNTINKLASKNGYTDPQLYIDAVEGQEEAYSNGVANASADVKAASDVSSLVNKLEGTDLNAASLSASATSQEAQSNLVSAYANSAAVNRRYGHVTGLGNYADIAAELSAGAQTLNTVVNNGTYNNALYNLENTNNAALNASLTSDVTSVANSVASSESSALSTIVNSASGNNNYFSDISDFAADDTFTDAANNISASSFNDFLNAVPADVNGVNTDNDDFIKAASAAADAQLAPAMESAAARYGIGNASFANASAFSKEASVAEESAGEKVLAAQSAVNVTSANSSIVSKVSSAAVADDGNANLAASMLSDIEGTKKALGLNYWTKVNGSVAVGMNNYIYNYNNFVAGLAALNHPGNSDVKDNNKDYYSLANDVITSDFTNMTKQDYANRLGNIVNALNDVKNANLTNAKDSTNIKKDGSNDDANDTLVNSSNKNTVDTVLGKVLTNSSDNAQKSAIKLLEDSNYFGVSTTNTNVKVSDLINAASKLATEVNGLKSQVPNDNYGTKGNTANGVNGYNQVNSLVTQPTNGVAEAALLSDGVDVEALNRESGAINTVNSAVSSAVSSASVAAKNHPNTNSFNANSYSENLSSAMSVASSNADENLTNEQSLSTANSAANDDDVTLASYFASSFSNDANSASANASTAFSAYYGYAEAMTKGTTGASMDANGNVYGKADVNAPDFNSAVNAYAVNKANAQNDHKLGVENANVVYNNSSHFLDVLKNAYLHTSYNFGSNGDKKVAVAKKGDRLTVLHLSVSRNNDWRGVVRYYVLDNTTGKKGYITGQSAYTKGAYLPSTPSTAIVSVKALRPVNVYNNYQSKGKPVATLKAGQVVNNVRVVYANPDEDAMGFTKVETSDYNFFSANTDYVEINTETTPNNTPTNNVLSDKLGNNGLGADTNDNNLY